MRKLVTLLVGALGAFTILVGGIGVAGYFGYNKSQVDPVQQVDAIIVLGGAHDGREEYGISLAQQGIANHLILSNPYWAGDKRIAAFCATKDSRFTVVCTLPVPSTTRGEALFTRELAETNGWNRVLVISWRFHLPRARYIFSQCFDGEIVMRPVPRDYNYSLAQWEYTYLYQTVGFVKAFVQGSC